MDGILNALLHRIGKGSLEVSGVLQIYWFGTTPFPAALSETKGEVDMALQ